MVKSSKFRDKVIADNEREKSRGSSYGHLMIPRGTKIFQVEGGDRVKLDFLPYTITDEHHMCRNEEREVAMPGTLWYRKPYRLHRNIGANNESAVCPTTINKKCPICEYRAKLQKSGKADEDEIKALKFSDRNLYVVVPIDHKEYDEAPHIFDISRYCFQDMLREETDEKPEFRAFFDPSEEGFTVNARFSEEKLGKNKYAAISRIDFEARKEGYTDEFLKKVPDLDQVLIILPYKELEAKFFELDADAESPAPEIESEEGNHSTRTHDATESNDREPVRTRKRHVEEPEKSRMQRRESTKDETDKSNECVACEGTGETSKGRECPICSGTGVNPKSNKSADEKQEKAPEPEEERRTLKRRMKQQEAKQKDDNKCPSGHKFGADCDKYPKDCSDCKLWDDCFDALEITPF